jgi:hypothetical protein
MGSKQFEMNGVKGSIQNKWKREQKKKKGTEAALFIIDFKHTENGT